MITKYKEGTLLAFTDGFERDYKLHLYKDTVLDPDGTYSDFTEATGTGYSIKTLLWVDATVTWDSVAGKYKATWPEQVWTNIENLNADGAFMSDNTNTTVFSAEAKVLGQEYTALGYIPSILLG